MTVKELIDILKTMPKDAIVICGRYSDMCDQEPPELKEVISKGRHGFGNPEWYTQYYPNQHKDNVKPSTIMACYFEGN